MSRSLAISARQITAICKGATKAGFVAEVKIGDVLVRLVPENSGKAARAYGTDESLDEELERWEANQSYNELYPQLSTLESRVMDQLFSKPDEIQPISAIRSAGPVTIKHLLDRKFVEVDFDPVRPERMRHIWLTAAGIKWMKRPPRKHIYL